MKRPALSGRLQIFSDFLVWKAGRCFASVATWFVFWGTAAVSDSPRFFLISWVP